MSVHAELANTGGMAVDAPVRLAGIGKRYSGTSVLEDVSLELRSGSVHALMGANGAGKSTLGKIIGGVVRADEGRMFVDGRPVRYGSPLEARAEGIATIAQELALVPQLSVMANVFLGVEPRRSGFVSRRAMRRDYDELVARWDFELNGDALVSSLRTADRQKVEILRAVASRARVIVMDEPTSSLTRVETSTLHRMIEALKSEGKAIVYVSHALGDVLEVADTVSVLRNGRLVRTTAASDDSGWRREKRSNCRSASSRTPFGIPELRIFSARRAVSPDTSGPSLSSFWMARSCSRRK